MPDVTIYHNPNCSTSKKVLALAQDAGVDVEVVQYLKTPPSREQLTWLVEHPRLMQRPLLVKGDHVVIGRPKERATALF